MGQTLAPLYAPQPLPWRHVPGGRLLWGGSPSATDECDKERRQLGRRRQRRLERQSPPSPQTPQPSAPSTVIAFTAFEDGSAFIGETDALTLKPHGWGVFHDSQKGLRYEGLFSRGRAVGPGRVSRVRRPRVSSPTCLEPPGSYDVAVCVDEDCGSSWQRWPPTSCEESLDWRWDIQHDGGRGVAALGDGQTQGCAAYDHNALPRAASALQLKGTRDEDEGDEEDAEGFLQLLGLPVEYAPKFERLLCRQQDLQMLSSDLLKQELSGFPLGHRMRLTSFFARERHQGGIRGAKTSTAFPQGARDALAAGGAAEAAGRVDAIPGPRHLSSWSIAATVSASATATTFRSNSALEGGIRCGRGLAAPGRGDLASLEVGWGAGGGRDSSSGSNWAEPGGQPAVKEPHARESVAASGDWFHIPFDELQFTGRLSERGCVYAGSWLGTRVAIRVLLAGDEVSDEQWRRVTEVLRGLRHPSLCLVVGVAEAGSELRCIISDWVDGGNLSGWLLEPENKKIPTTSKDDDHRHAIKIVSLLRRHGVRGDFDRLLPKRRAPRPPDLLAALAVFQGVAAACEYLDSKGLHHGSLCPSNVLLSGSNNYGSSHDYVRVTGFCLWVLQLQREVHYAPATGIRVGGRRASTAVVSPADEWHPGSSPAAVPSLTSLGSDTSSAWSAAGNAPWGGGVTTATSRWCAPEVHRQNLWLGDSPAADVYSLGLLLWAVLTGQPPLAELSVEQMGLLLGHGLLQLEPPRGLPAPLHGLLERTLAPLKAERIEAQELPSALSAARTALPASVEERVEELLSGLP